jgi:SAM-dependent methyltransferase
MATPSPNTTRKLLHLTNLDLYNAWAPTYDHDSNVLQSLDTAAFSLHLPPLISPNHPITLLDLGCGTGRNTEKLRSLLPAGSAIVAVDASEEMLSHARRRLAAGGGDGGGVEVRWVVCDLAHLARGDKVDAVVSTLVLEHIPLSTFFGAVAGAVKDGGWVYISDMHPGMGRSKAGFKTAAEGGGGGEVKVHGVSWNHGIAETLEAAGKNGLVLQGEVQESGVVDEEHARTLGERAKKWVGVKMLVVMTFRKVLRESNYFPQHL